MVSTELSEGYSFGATFKFCVAKYSSLRQEMQSNRVFTVSAYQWRDTLCKALQIKMSYKGRALRAINRGGTNNHYSILLLRLVLYPFLTELESVSITEL